MRPGETGVVVGAGPIGILHGMLFKVAGGRVIIADVSKLRLEMASRAGLEVVNVKEQALADVVMDLTDGLGADIAVDAVGTQLDTCLKVVGKRGRISLFGTNENATAVFQQAIIQQKEITIFGVFVGSHCFPRAIQLLEQRVIKPSFLISHLLPVAELLNGVEAARKGEAMKVVIRSQ
jgi:L-iditol 2-dehydrogenase